MKMPKMEVVVQTGADFDVIPNNKKLLNTIKKTTHKNLGEFTVRKFEKKIEPQDFSHQSVNEGYSKPHRFKLKQVISQNA